MHGTRSPEIYLLRFSYVAITLYGGPFQGTSPPEATTIWHHISITSRCRIRFALFRFRSPLITESLLVSFPAVTEMIQFTAFLSIAELFGNPGFKDCVRLARAYRSLPRP